MERSLLALSFALGGVVWVCGLLTSGFGRGAAPPGAGKLPRLWLAIGAVLPILVFLATLPAKPPIFTAGHGFGSGFLVGGLLGILGVWTILRALHAVDNGEHVSAATAIAAPAGLALAAAIVPSLMLRDGLIDALSGVSIGWVCSALVALTGLSGNPRTKSMSAATICIAFSTAAVVLFCALSGMGELRGVIDLVGKNTAIVHWDVPGMAFASCLSVLALLMLLPAHFALRIPLVPLITGWIERGRDSDEARASARHAWQIGFCSIVTLILGCMVAARFAEQGDHPFQTKSALLKPIFALLGPNPLFHVVALGVIAAILIRWLVSDHRKQLQLARNPLAIGQSGALAVLLLAAAGMVAFQFAGGFGLCVLLTILLLTTALTGGTALQTLHELPSDDTAGAVTLDGQVDSVAQLVRLLLFGSLLALYRIFSLRFHSELRGVGLTDHYALFGMIVGVLLPQALTSLLNRARAGSTDTDSSRLFRLVITGLLVLVVPTLVLTLWGAKCALAIMIGMLFSTVFEASLLPAIIAVAVALAMTQWLHHVLPLAQLTRDQKVTLLGWTTVVVIVLLLVSEFTGRLQGIAPGRGPSPAKGGPQ